MDTDRWVGWAAGGAVVMIVIGAFQALSGFISLFNDEWVIRGFDAYYFVDLSALAWWWLLMGLLLVLVGFGVLAGQRWARIVGIIVVGLNIISQLFWMPVYPLWSILLLVFDILVIYALVVVKEMPTGE